MKSETEQLEYKWKDVTFQVRAHATAKDRYEIDLLYDVDKTGKAVVPRGLLHRTAIARFVTGWAGVTEGGQPVPFSLENLERLPAGEDDVILLLGSFVINRTGLFPTEAEAAEKKE